MITCHVPLAFPLTALIATALIGGCAPAERVGGTPADAASPRSESRSSLADAAQPSVGIGSIDQPAIGPSPSSGIGGDGFVLVKNWDFGTTGTVTSIADLDRHFQYHDQFGTIGNGTNYGAVIVAPDDRSALKHMNQPVEGRDTGGKPARAFVADAMRTYLVPLRGATECHPQRHDVGCGSFQAIWTLPRGGSLLGKDLLWETRVRYRTPPYFWFAIWTCGNKWDRGAEIDVVEGFGYDNGGGNTNFDGRFWHVGIVGGREDVPYGNWGESMQRRGVASFDGSAYHIWSLLYKTDDSIEIFMDGISVQTGAGPWTLKAAPDGEPLDMSFIFDGGWGHTQVASVNKPLPATAFADSFYEWDYSRVYLRAPGRAVER